MWTVEKVLDSFQKDSNVIKAVLKLAEFQTRDEFTDEYTKYTNNVGFNSPDARFLTGFAKFYKSKIKRFNKDKGHNKDKTYGEKSGLKKDRRFSRERNFWKDKRKI